MHLPQITLLGAGFGYAVLDIFINVNAFRSAKLDDNQKEAYYSVISIFAILFIHAAFSDYKHNFIKCKAAIKKNKRPDKRILLYQKELMQQNSDNMQNKMQNQMLWEFLPFNIKKEISGPKDSDRLEVDKINKIFPDKNHINLENYFYLSWEQYVKKKNYENRVIHYARYFNNRIRLPIWHSDYALLTMFSIDLNLSIWCMEFFNKPDVKYPSIFLSNFIIIMLLGSKFISWRQKRIIVSNKSPFRKKKFIKIQHLIDKCLISNPQEKIVFKNNKKDHNYGNLEEVLLMK
jgi:hypothetical protein